MRQYLKIFVYLPFTVIFRLQCWFSGKVKLGSNLEVCGFIFLKNKGTIFVGDNVRINSGRFSNFASGGLTSIQVMKGAELIIGDRVGISNSAITCAKKIEIQSDVNIGADCVISDTDFHSLNYIERTGRRFKKTIENVSTASVKIGHGCFIGMRVIVLKGVTIGARSVIGAASVVSSNIESDSVAVGNPCKRIRGLK